jgi:hypothetical protein
MPEARKAGRHATGKITVSIRMQQKTKSRIEDAISKLGTTMSEYVEKAIESQLGPEPLKPEANFAAFFAKYPLLPGGDEVLAALLQEREESL